MPGLNIVTRPEWGAAPPTNPPSSQPTPTRHLVLHHAGGGLTSGARRVRAIQRFHQSSRGWNDIAYSYLIDRDGTVFEGRGGGVREGATFGLGGVSHSICLLGNFDEEEPTEAALQSLVEVIQWGHGEGWWPNRLTGGHRDFRPTACPGDNLYPLIPAINREVEENMLSIDEIRQAIREEAGAAVWAPDKYRIPDPTNPDGLHPNTILRLLRSDVAKVWKKVAAGVAGGATATQIVNEIANRLLS